MSVFPVADLMSRFPKQPRAISSVPSNPRESTGARSRALAVCAWGFLVVFGAVPIAAQESDRTGAGDRESSPTADSNRPRGGAWSGGDEEAAGESTRKRGRARTERGAGARAKEADDERRGSRSRWREREGFGHSRSGKGPGEWRRNGDRGRPDRSGRSGEWRRGGPRRERPSVDPDERRRKNRDRWKELDSDRRAKLELLFARLKELPDEKRRAFIERVRRMGSRSDRCRRAVRGADRVHRPGGTRELFAEKKAKESRRRMLERLPAELRAELESLPPEARKIRIGEHFAAKRQKLIESLPAATRAEIESLSPRDQARRLRRHFTDELWNSTFPDAAEAAALGACSAEDLKRLMNVTRPDGRVHAAPPFISAATWARWTALRPFERARLLKKLTGSDRSDRHGRGDRRGGRERWRDERRHPSRGDGAHGWNPGGRSFRGGERARRERGSESPSASSER